VIPAGPKAADEAEKAVRRLAAQVDERKHPRTNATLDQLLDRYLETLDVAESTRKMYAKYADKHPPASARVCASGSGGGANDQIL
jgi:hypothetical protein